LGVGLAFEHLTERMGFKTRIAYRRRAPCRSTDELARFIPCAPSAAIFPPAGTE